MSSWQVGLKEGTRVIVYVSQNWLALHWGICGGLSDTQHCAGMHKAQHMAMGHGHLHLPSKGTVITVVIVLHVVAMSYLLYAMYTAHRCSQPPLCILYTTRVQHWCCMWMPVERPWSWEVAVC